MSFEQELIITLVDKGLLALMLAAVAFALNWLLQRQKAGDELRKAFAPQRAASYGALWSKTERLGFSGHEPITSEQRKEIYEDLTDWYYGDKGGLFLSHEGMRLFIAARDRLKDDSTDDRSIRAAFSALRTQLKVDCGTYTSREAQKKII